MSLRNLQIYSEYSCYKYMLKIEGLGGLSSPQTVHKETHVQEV